MEFLNLLFNIVSFGAASNAQNKARKAEEAARRTELAKANLEAQAKRREQARNALIAGANLTATSEAAGVSGSSSQMAGQYSVNNQASYNASFLDESINLANQGIAYKNKAASAMGEASTWSSIGKVGSAVLKSGTIDKISGLFEGPATTSTDTTQESSNNSSSSDWIYGKF